MKYTTKNCFERLREKIKKMDPITTPIGHVTISGYTLEFVMLIQSLYDSNYFNWFGCDRLKDPSNLSYNFDGHIGVTITTLHAQTKLASTWFLDVEGKSSKQFVLKNIDFSKIPPFYNTIIISTNKGLKTPQECLKYKLGGRLIIII